MKEMNKYIVKSCEKCKWYYPEFLIKTGGAPDPCGTCRRFFPDRFEKVKK